MQLPVTGVQQYLQGIGGRFSYLVIGVLQGVLGNPFSGSMYLLVVEMYSTLGWLR